MSDFVTNQATDLAILADATTAVTGALITPTIELFQNDVIPSRNVPLSAYVLANYDGHAPKAVTWLAPSISDGGDVELVGTAPEFRPTGAVTPNSIYGALLLSSTGALLGATRFAGAPLGMASVLDSLIVTVRLRLQLKGAVELVS